MKPIQVKRQKTKLRIIQKDGLFIPQFYKKGYYSNKWVGFGNPNFKYQSLEKAKEFINLAKQSITQACGKQEIVYSEE